MAGLKIALLGGCYITWDEKPVGGVNTPRLQSLLAYFLLHRDAPISRQQLAFQFWPASSESQARTNLRHLVHSLRSALPEGEVFLPGDSQEIEWNPQARFSLDVDEFERSLNTARSSRALDSALNRYRGDLLPACYDEWILPYRERLLHRYLEGLEQLAALLEKSADNAQAIQVLQRLLLRDPTNEGAYQRLMALHLADDDRAGALHAYQTYATLFQRDLGLEPSIAMQETYEELLGLRPTATSEPSPGALRLVGREGEWKRLLTAWREAITGKPCLLLLEGEAGIGKTRLAEEMLTWVERQGMRRALARCYQAEARLAYAPVTAWLRSGPLPALEPLWLSEIARLLPEILLNYPTLPHPAPLTEDWQRQRLHESLARAVLCGGMPALLVLDDIQWSDADTLEWLNYLLRYDPNAPFMLVATLRSDELDTGHPLGTLLAVLRRSHQLVEITLGPLNEHQGAELAIQAAGDKLEATRAQAIHHEAEGNPLFIVELAQSGLERVTPQSESQTLPVGIQAVISSRLDRLSPNARQTAELAAVIGRQFSFQVLAETAQEDEESLIESLDELWLRRIVREQGADAYDFSHDKIRQVMYGELSHARRRWLHRRTAETLERLQITLPDSAIGEIASHYDRAGVVEKALQGYQAAAQTARCVYAHHEALDWLGRAEALLPRLSDQERRRRHTVDICETQGDVLMPLARRPEAIQAYQQALQALGKVEPVGYARISRKQGDAWVEDRRYDAAWECFSQAQAILEANPQEQDPDWQHEWLQVRLAQMHWHYWLYQWEQIASLASQIQGPMDNFGTPLQQVEYYHLLARKAFLQVGFLGSEASRSAAARAMQSAQTSGDLNALLVTHFSYGFQLLWSGELEQANEHITQALASARSIGNVLQITQCLTYLTILERRRRNLEQVSTLAQESLEAAQSCQRADYIGVAQANQAWLAWQKGDLQAAALLGQAALETWNTGSYAYPIQWLGLWPMIAVRLAGGEEEQATRLAQRLIDPAQQRLPPELSLALSQAVQIQVKENRGARRTSLVKALEMAIQLGYL